ncbi:MAG: hypothetical protein LUI01_02860, partial [Firmicutes bacterium]|nr:hypothetical protein [Bacillota bacterium]
MSETAGEIKVEGAKVKTQVDDIDRNIYDVKNADSYDYKMKKGLDREIVLEISEMKGDPDWMRDI